MEAKNKQLNILVYNINYFTFVTLVINMETKNDNLSAQQSLDLIASMINQAKGHVRNQSFYYLFWGWVIVTANLGAYLLFKIKYHSPYWIWLIVIPAWLISIAYGYKQSNQARSATHIDKINMALWISYGVFATTIPFLGQWINYQINPIILMVGGICTFTSGVVLRFNPLQIGGIIIFASGIISFFVNPELQLLVAATAIALGYLVPGYILKAQK